MNELSGVGTLSPSGAGETKGEIMTSIFEEKETKPKLQKSIGEQPGGLRSETRMTIQTREAQKMVVGRRGGRGVQPIIGLLNFGRRMKLLWLSAQVDDPYADWFLLRIEASMNEAKALIHDKRKWLDEVLHSMEGFDIGVAHSLEPINVSIVFQNPYGYMGAYLVADYDALCRSVFTASHIGLIDRKIANNTIMSAGKMIRRTFNLATQWKFTGVIREDIRVKNPLGLKAIDMYGECPEFILNKTKRAKIAPEIRTQSKPVVTVKNKHDGNGGKQSVSKARGKDKAVGKPDTGAEKREVAAVSIFDLAKS
jgi:integrating conjugative element protein (TIGR03761 family)